MSRKIIHRSLKGHPHYYFGFGTTLLILLWDVASAIPFSNCDPFDPITVYVCCDVVIFASSHETYFPVPPQMMGVEVTPNPGQVGVPITVSITGTTSLPISGGSNPIRVSYVKSECYYELPELPAISLFSFTAGILVCKCCP